MKMKKTYAAALAAAMVLTAGLSAQAADFTFNGKSEHGIVSISGTGTIDDSEIVDAVNGKDLDLGAGTTIGGQTIATTDDLKGYATAEGLTSVAADTANAATIANEAKTQAQTNAGNIEDLQGTVNKHTEQIGTLQTQVAANTAFANTVAQDVAKNTTNIEKLQTSMTEAQGDIDGLTNRVNQNETNIAGLQADMKTANTNIENAQATADGAYRLAGTTSDKVNRHIDPEGNISGVDGTFTGTVNAGSGSFSDNVVAGGDVIASGGSFTNNVTVGGDFTAGTVFGDAGLIGGVSMEDGHVQASDGIWAGNENQFHVDENGNMTTDGNVTANTVEGTVIKGDYGMFGDTVISANEGIVMNKVTEAADGSTTNEEVFKVDKDGNLTAESANISGNLTADTVTATNGNFDLVTGTDGKFTGTVSATNGTFSGDVAVGGDIYVAGRTEGVGESLAAHDTAIAENADKIAQNTTAIANNSSRINALDRKVSDLGGEIDNVGAISSALAGLHPLDYDGTGSKFQLAAAMGSYDGTQAAAIGGFYHFNEDIMMSVGGATSFGGDNKSAFNVGLSFRVGQGSSGKRVSNDEVLAQLTAMNDKIAALEAENQQLSEKVAALEGGEGAEAAEAE